MQTLEQLRNGELKGATALKLCEGLTEFPVEIYELADTLEKLELSGNNLSALPADFSKLRKLRILFCSDNPFTRLPEVLGDCPLLDTVGFKSCLIEDVPTKAINPNLRWLILTNNRIKELPANLSMCTRIEKLALAGNQLTEIPDLSNCKELGLLRISANRLANLPQWLLSMPKLSWLGYSGNPFCIHAEVPQLQAIAWDTLEVGAVLGQGASGIIYKGTMPYNDSRKDVAIKVYKGAVTSDGLPEDEMNASILAGEHDGLVKNIGQLTGHPENMMGLVMELIPETYYNLGMPPSLQSCTRDVFAANMQLGAAQAANIATTVASAAAHLHSKGILNGDLYAHNTLTDDKGNALISDFGAAAFYDKNDVVTAKALERIEVRALGCMLDDLIPHITTSNNDFVTTTFKQLRDACWQPDILSRPNFETLYNSLSALV